MAGVWNHSLAVHASASMSASGYKRTYGEVRQRVRFTPKSGHSDAQEWVGLKKRTLNVRFTPNSGHKWVTEFMSAYDPQRTFARPFRCPKNGVHRNGLSDGIV